MRYLLNTAALVLMLATPAMADEIIFYTGGSGYGGPFSGPLSVYTATQSGTINCPTGGCAADNIQNTLSYAAQPAGQSTVAVTVTATDGGITRNVWGDFDPHFGGLGVSSSGVNGTGTTGNGTGTGSDQIDGTEHLHIHFASTVTLTGLATLFDLPHADGTPPAFGNVLLSNIGFNNSFLFSTDGTNFSSVLFGNANTLHGVNVTGQDFYFAENGAAQPQFYVSALTYVTGSVGTRCTDGCAVPGPIAGAGLPGLIVAGGALLGWVRRRKAVTAA